MSKRCGTLAGQSESGRIHTIASYNVWPTYKRRDGHCSGSINMAGGPNDSIDAHPPLKRVGLTIYFILLLLARVKLERALISLAPPPSERSSSDQSRNLTSERSLRFIWARA